MDRLSSLAAVGATREVLRAHGLATKHALGQNFLVNDDIIKKIVALAALEETDFVLEVGPGIGTLTEALLKCAGAVASVERDRDLPAVLEDTLAPWASRFALMQKDALDLQLSDIEAARASIAWVGLALPNKFVSNLPYAVAATIILDFFQRFESLESATVMVQREVGERIMAVPGTKNYGAYTVKLGMFARPVDKFAVSPGNFFPPPHVESMVLRLDRRDSRGRSGRAAFARRDFGRLHHGRRRLRKPSQDHCEFVQDVFLKQGRLGCAGIAPDVRAVRHCRLAPWRNAYAGRVHSFGSRAAGALAEVCSGGADWRLWSVCGAVFRL